MVRGWVITCVAVTVAFAVGTPAFAQAPQPVMGRPVAQPLPTDELFAPAPAVPPRIAFQPNRQPAGVPDEPDFTLPDGSVIAVPQGKSQQFRFTRRYGTPNTVDSQLLPDGSRRFVFTGGVILNAIGDDGVVTEFAADDVVVWVRGLAIDNIQNGFQSSPDKKSQTEAYMAGNVVVRTKSNNDPLQTLRADEVYYDMTHERAVCIKATLEFIPNSLTTPVRLHGEEIRRLDAENWESLRASFDGSYLPSEPGLRFDAKRVTMNMRKATLRNVFGIPYRYLLTGEPVEGDEKTLTSYHSLLKVAGVPVFYLPRIRVDGNDPLGPFIGASFGQSNMFGFGVYTSWDMFDLLALKPPKGQRWRLNLDYMAARGYAMGTDYTYTIPANDSGLSPPNGAIKLYGLNDHGTDLLGGGRGPEPPQPKTPGGATWRGRADWRHQQEVIEGLYYQGQFALLSDKNFLEEYYNQDFTYGPNHETFANLAYQKRNYELSALAEVQLNRPWIAETSWLPRLDGYLTGQTFLNDIFVYSGHASAGYAQARPSAQNPGPVLSTDQRIDTGRFDLMQELSVPFPLGPFKLAPYATLDLADYTSDLNGDNAARVWGGGGARGTLPLTRLYENVNSDLFNLRGINHKVVFGANYLYAKTNVPFSQLPLLDRLNDDSTDQSWRNITPMQTSFVPGANGALLATGGDPTSQYNPQQYLVRRAATNRLDTLADINVLQADMRQRFQTKRGYPGMEHTVDALIFDMSASYFPEASRDNFGNPFAFLEYGVLWNIGDRTAVYSNGWFEPYATGSRYYTVGAAFSRSDRTSFNFAFRQIDPLQSKAVSGSITYQLSPRYFVNSSTSYDFGVQNIANSLNLMRQGTDLTVTLGLTYNSLVSNLGIQFMIMPNMLQSLVPGGQFTGTPINGRR